MNYIPTADEVEEFLPAIIAQGDLSVIAELLDTSADTLEHLLKHDPTATSQIEAAKAQVNAFLELRILALAPLALKTIENVMLGNVTNAKIAMAAVRAAESTLDRNSVTAKVARSQGNSGNQGAATETIRPLQEVLQGVPQEDQVAVIDRYLEMMSEVQAFRNGNVLPRRVEAESEDETGAGGEAPPLQDQGESK